MSTHAWRPYDARWISEARTWLTNAARIKEQTLKAELAKRGFESVSIKRELPGGRIQVEANKLYPVHVEAGESIYAPVPVSLSVELDARGRVKSIAGDTPNPAAVTDAARAVHQDPA